jgi:hypothetical protein
MPRAIANVTLIPPLPLDGAGDEVGFSERLVEVDVPLEGDDVRVDGRSATDVITSPTSTLDDKSSQADRVLLLPSQKEKAHRSPMPSIFEFNSAIAEAALLCNLAALVACALRASNPRATLS